MAYRERYGVIAVMGSFLDGLVCYQLDLPGHINLYKILGELVMHQMRVVAVHKIHVDPAEA